MPSWNSARHSRRRRKDSGPATGPIRQKEDVKMIRRGHLMAPVLNRRSFLTAAALLTELVAMQRGNLEMGNIAPQDISNQIPAWSIVTSAYLFRDADHLKKVFASEVGQQLKKMASDQLGIHILGPTYFGVRHVGLKPKKKISTPADMAGIKLRMPGGDAWQFLGQSLGANPTPMPYAEVYTGLQSGAIDGQDNPLPNVLNMKFYEVMSQIVLTSHLVGFDILAITKKAWSAMTPQKQAAFQAAAEKAIEWGTQQHLKQEA